MKTTFKKITVVFMVLFMMLSVFTATTVNAEETVADTKIYYQISDFYTEKHNAVPGVAVVHCYIYALNNTDPDFEKYSYMSKETKCEYDEETGLYYYDLAEKFAHSPLKENALYGVIFTVVPTGPYPNIIGADVTMGVDCMGDTAYTVESVDSAPQDAPSGAYPTFWTKNNSYCLVKDLGDVNKDGEVNIMDASFVQMTVAKYSIEEEIDLSFADMNNDKLISITDATLIQMKIAKYI